MSIDIRPLPRDGYTGYPLPLRYCSREHYRVFARETPGGWQITLQREALECPVSRDAALHLYADYWPTATAWGAFSGEELMGAIEFFHETWNNRLRVTNLAVLPAFRRRGVGTALMERAKARGRALGCRSVVLETQSCNTPAIDFYRARGFTLTGLDLTAYHDDDVARGEVRLEMVCPLTGGEGE